MPITITFFTLLVNVCTQDIYFLDRNGLGLH